MHFLCVNQVELWTSYKGARFFGTPCILPLNIRQKKTMIKYWKTLLSKNENTILYKIYKLLKEDANNNITYNGSKWAYQIKIILDHCGLSNLWLNQEYININLNSIEKGITDTYLQE